LSQIAWDGSQKLPIRLLATIADNLRAGRPIARLCMGVAAWMWFVRRSAFANAEITDPLARRLTEIGLACRDEAQHDCALFFDRTQIFAEMLLRDGRFAKAVHLAYEQLRSETVGIRREMAVGQ
jgi:fructuronate reductase